MIGLPASIATMLAAAAACPGCGRSSCRSGANTASVPSCASTLIAAVMSATWSSPRRSVIASTSMPSMPSVPLMSARPSFSRSRTGSMPAAARACAAGIRSPAASLTTPSPRMASAQWASGARSPEQPRLPYSCTTGVMPAFSSAAYARTVSSLAPVWPVARVASRSSMSALATSVSTSGPDPAAWLRTRPSWSWARSSAGMCRVASAPKPVETP